MLLDIYQVDSFTSEPFKGNPAGVCITENELSEKLMLSIASEMALSETAFLSLDNNRLRWFTPKIEVSLCGHGTLATAWVLYQKDLMSDGETITFDTLSGSLSATVNGNIIEMDFPIIEVKESQEIDIQKLSALEIDINDVIFYGKAGLKEFVEIRTDEMLLNLNPDFNSLSKMSGRGVIVTAMSSDPEKDFVSRNFVPWVGINEDPVTGSAHCALANYWSEKLNKSTMLGYQASERGGFVTVELMNTGRVKLSGTAVTVIEGKMNVNFK